MSLQRLQPTRRELVASLGAAGALAAVPPAWAKLLVPAKRRVGPGAFLDGVASGEPGATAVTFWSRLETNRPRSGARLVVARDAGMRRVVATAIVPTGAGVNGTLKVRVGDLRPATEYFYLWESGTGVSPVGRTRTMPPPESPTRLRLACSSCQQYSVGYFGAHADAALLPELDLYLFLGDYIYEARKHFVRRDPFEAVDLASYRGKYALYRADPGLRELHRLHPVVHVWDDHEVENNYSDNNPAPAPAQRSAGYRASFEWLPRMAYAGNRNRLYRKLRLGAMADLFLLDERQYRTGDLDGRPRAILGETQMQWLIKALKRSTATWKLVANQLAMAQIPFGEAERHDLDAWDGYPEDRARLLSEIERAGIENVVFLSGDAHIFVASLLSSDFQAMGDGSNRPAAAVEYVTGSVTSLGADQDEATVRARAPWIQQYNGRDHGYARLEIDGGQITTDYLASDFSQVAGATTPFERFVQPANSNQLQRMAPPVAPPAPPAGRRSGRRVRHPPS